MKAGDMSELKELQEVELNSVDEALALIDQRLGTLSNRELVSASEVSDLLLDVRTLLDNNEKI